MKKFVKRNDVAIMMTLSVGYFGTLAAGFVLNNELIAASSMLFMGAICLLSSKI